MPRYVFVTGTDTGVGKTITTAALAARLSATGRRVMMVKPVQTGHIRPDDPERAVLEAQYSDVVTESDAQIVARLAGIETFTHVTLRLPMAPVPAARAEEVSLPTVDEHAALIRALATRTEADHVLIEGAGGVLVDFGGHTLADLARALAVDLDGDVSAIIVARSRLGTLNHTALTAEALSHRGVEVSGIIIGSWPDPALPVDVDNRQALSTIAPLLGAIPAAVGHSLGAEEFQAQAPRWLDLPL
ncbi:dethiobiotin synthase [Auritidibacter ignavus]|nr:dethiobiotin synthase [Auritidibacter sp. NML130574]PXA79404.1 dethiobiotin synthase [Auritidibacter sp. NML120636]RMX22938.1 dethiobiotin synthase [Auritidibacter ignavus]